LPLEVLMLGWCVMGMLRSGGLKRKDSESYSSSLGREA
jgi:hypothetical protein